MCGGQMRLIAFITEGAQIRKILDHIGVDSQAPSIATARGPPLWEDCDAQMGTGCKSSRTGIRLRKRHPTIRSISASTGDRSNRRFRCAAG
ncbi:MAG TPA: hypothetical protein DCP03_18410 [Polaromonas sp.]|nr:hypothetical protein [Polaromonas sp.]